MKWTRKEKLLRAGAVVNGHARHERERIIAPPNFGLPVTELARGRMCGSKRNYSKRGAIAQIRHFERTRRGAHGQPEALQCYECPFCSRWHLTKEKD